MLVRTALPLLLLSLLALPAHADLAVPPSPCERMEEGAVCGQDATCRHLKCGKDNDDDGTFEYEWDCRQCMTQEQFETFKRYEQAGEEYASRTLQGRLLHWGPWALGASCLITLVWYQLRRRPSGSEPPSPPTA